MAVARSNKNCAGTVRKKDAPCVISAAYHCNSACLFCYNKGGQNIRPQLSFDEMVRQIEQAAGAGYNKVAFFGGECTVEPYFFDLLEAAQKFGLKVRLETNGQMFADPEFIGRLKGYDLDSCQFSFHTYEESVHDELTRNPGGFRKTVKGILNFKKAFPHVRLDSYTVITRRNVRQLYKTACYLHKFFGVQEAFFSFLISPAERENFKSLAVSFNEARPCLQRALEYLSGHNLAFRIDKCPKCVFPQYHELHHYEKGVFDPDDYCKHAVCESCPLSADCPGFSKQYVAVFGFDGLRLGGFQQDELKYFFAGLNMGMLRDIRHALTFDECNNPVLNLEREEGSWERTCKEANIPLCLMKSTGRLIDVWNDFQFTPEAVTNALQKNTNVPCEDLIRALCHQLKTDFKAKVSAENILLTAGSRPALYALFLAHIRPGGLVVLKKGMWDGYRYGLDQAGGRVVEVSSYDELEDVGPDGLELVIVNNPQLPSVRERLAEKDVKRLIRFCNQRGAFLLVDEIGNRLSPDPFSVLSYCDLSKDHVIVTQSFSKNYFIPQYKAGYMVAHPEVISKVKRIIDFSGYRISPRSVQAAHAVLCSPQQWQQEKATLIYKKGTW